jgi:hypothetical protein
MPFLSRNVFSRTAKQIGSYLLVLDAHPNLPKLENRIQKMMKIWQKLSVVAIASAIALLTNISPATAVSLVSAGDIAEKPILSATCHDYINCYEIAISDSNLSLSAPFSDGSFLELNPITTDVIPVPHSVAKLNSVVSFLVFGALGAGCWLLSKTSRKFKRAKLLW